MRVEVLSNTGGLIEAGTDAFCSDPMHTSSCLKVMESHPKTGRREARHLVAYEDGEPIAYLPCYLQHSSFHDDLERVLLTPGERRIAQHASGLLPSLSPSLSPALVCSAPESFYCRLIHRAGGDPSRLREVCRSLTDALVETGRSEGVDLVCLMNLRRRDGVLWQHLLEEDYLHSPRATSAYLPVRWKSFNAYYRSLSRNRKKSMKSEISHMRRANLEIRPVPDFDLIADALEGVIGRMWQARGRECPYDRGFYSLVKRKMAGGTRVLVGSIGGEIKGFTLLFSTAEEMCAYQYGALPEKVVRDSAMYFNVCFTETIRQGIDLGMREIRYGPTALKAKAARGCVLEKLGMFIKCLHRRHLPAMKAVVYRNVGRRSADPW